MHAYQRKQLKGRMPCLMHPNTQILTPLIMALLVMNDSREGHKISKVLPETIKHFNEILVPMGSPDNKDPHDLLSVVNHGVLLKKDSIHSTINFKQVCFCNTPWYGFISLIFFLKYTILVTLDTKPFLIFRPALGFYTTLSENF